MTASSWLVSSVRWHARRATTRAAGSGASTRSSPRAGKCLGRRHPPLRVRGRPADHPPRRGAIDPRVCATVAGGRFVALDLHRPQRAGRHRPRAVARGRQQTLAPDAFLGADQRPARAPRRDRRDGRVAGDHHARPRRATMRAILADPARRTNRTARRYLLRGLLRCGLCGAHAVARPRAAGSAATSAPAAPASAAAARCRRSPTRSSCS